MEQRFRQLNWSPLRAIRERCLWCCRNQIMEVRACTSERCPLFPFRHGKVSASEPLFLKAIRKKCLDCVTGSHIEVAKCASMDCSLWDFRWGVSPYRGGQKGMNC